MMTTAWPGTWSLLDIRFNSCVSVWCSEERWTRWYMFSCNTWRQLVIIIVLRCFSLSLVPLASTVELYYTYIHWRYFSSVIWADFRSLAMICACYCTDVSHKMVLFCILMTEIVTYVCWACLCVFVCACILIVVVEMYVTCISKMANGDWLKCMCKIFVSA